MDLGNRFFAMLRRTAVEKRAGNANHGIYRQHDQIHNDALHCRRAALERRRQQQAHRMNERQHEKRVRQKLHAPARPRELTRCIRKFARTKPFPSNRHTTASQNAVAAIAIRFLCVANTRLYAMFHHTRVRYGVATLGFRRTRTRASHPITSSRYRMYS